MPRRSNRFSSVTGAQDLNNKKRAKAYCATCDLCEEVNLNLTGRRFDCPRWDLNRVHVAAVVGDDVRKVRAYMKFAVCAEKWQKLREGWPSNSIWVLTIASFLILTTFDRYPISPPIASVMWVIFIIAVGDTLVYVTANAFSSQRPRFSLRSAVRALSLLARLAVAFAISYTILPDQQFVVGAGPEPLGPWSALYFSIVTMATVGYGDIHPALDASACARVLVAAEIALGLYFVTVYIATLISWVRGVERPPTLAELIIESEELDKLDEAWIENGYKKYLYTARCQAARQV